MRNEKEVQSRAKLHAEFYYPKFRWYEANDYMECMQDFISGAQWMQKDLLESMSKDFDYEKWAYDNLYSIRDGCYGKKVKELFISLGLKNQKIIQEKDKEIAELESKLKAERNDVLYMDKRVLEEKEKYDQAVKDMRYIFENLYETDIYLVLDKFKEIRKRHGISDE